jgi:hypothetical protein
MTMTIEQGWIVVEGGRTTSRRVDLNELAEIVWPIKLRVFKLTGAVVDVLDVEIDGSLIPTMKRGRVDLNDLVGGITDEEVSWRDRI